MVSICLIYSNDRLLQLMQTLRYLSTIPSFSEFEKILIVDGFTSYNPPGFKVINVARDGKLFCKAMLWEAGLASAAGEIIVMMDCDRLPHPKFFDQASMVDGNSFIYCSYLYQLSAEISDSTLVLMLNTGAVVGLAKPDFRVVFANGTVRAAKTPMSGCVAFQKSAYRMAGGVSRAYRGWGFSDTDFYAAAYFAGCVFVPLDLIELHLYHDYPIDRKLLVAMNLWNGIRFYDKWLLPVHDDIVGIASDFKLSLDFIRLFSLDDFIEYIENHE